jgi:hypothetical protein
MSATVASLVARRSVTGVADARLIASAPDFLTAAVNYVRWIDTYGCTMDDAMLKAMEAAFGAGLRRAISRAEGRTP